MKLGLDLSGGVYFLLEVDTSVVVDGNLKSTFEEYKQYLIKNKISFIDNATEVKDGQIVVTFRTDKSAQRGENVFKGEFSNLVINKEQRGSLWVVTATLPEQEILQLEDQAIEQNLVASMTAEPS